MSEVVGQDDSPLFAYGTLRLAAVLHSLIGRELRSSAAWLPGYAPFQLRGTPYPGVRPLRGAVTPGSLYSGLNSRQWQQLDHYEGVRYRRRLLRIIPHAGSTAVTAWVYLLAPTCRGQLSQEPWQISHFMQRRHQRQPLSVPKTNSQASWNRSCLNPASIPATSRSFC